MASTKNSLCKFYSVKTAAPHAFRIPHSAFRILFLAGDVSGDIHTALLMREVAARHPDWQLFVAGGAQMQKVAREKDGEVLGDTSHYGVIGFVPVADAGAAPFAVEAAP